MRLVICRIACSFGNACTIRPRLHCYHASRVQRDVLRVPLEICLSGRGYYELSIPSSRIIGILDIDYHDSRNDRYVPFYANPSVLSSVVSNSRIHASSLTKRRSANLHLKIYSLFFLRLSFFHFFFRRYVSSAVACLKTALNASKWDFQ